MVRPRKFDPRQVGEALLDVFWSRGYARASIGELSAATGLLRGSLYSAYGSKEDMFRAAIEIYVRNLTKAFETNKTGLDAVEHVLKAVVSLTVSDPERRGCLILNAIPESHAMSSEMQAILRRELNGMHALYRAHLRAVQVDAQSVPDPLVAMVFAASVSIRVLGRAGQSQKILRDIAKGAIEAAYRSFESTTKNKR